MASVVEIALRRPVFDDRPDVGIEFRPPLGAPACGEVQDRVLDLAIYRATSKRALGAIIGGGLRNDAKARINWIFTTQQARKKLGRAYPSESHNPCNAVLVSFTT